MTWKQMLRSMSTLMVLVLALAACGVSTTPQGESEGETGDAASGEAEGDAEVASGEGTTIRWRTRPADADEEAVYGELNTLVNETLAEQNITVEYDPGVNQGYFEKLKTELASGTAPDIFWIGAVELADFVASEQILDLKPYIDNDSDFTLDSFYEQPIEELSRDGAVYGLPRDISTMVVYYNADLFAKADLPSPKDLAEKGEWNTEAMLESARQLTDAANQQYGVGFGNWWGPSWGYFVNVTGGSVFNEDRTACALDEPKSIEGAALAQLLYEEQLIPSGDAESEALFNAGKIAMYFNGRWFTPGVRTNAEFNWDVAEMPAGEEPMTWLFWGPYLVNANTEDPEAAWAVLKEITSAEAMAKVAELGTNIPARNNEEAVDTFLASSPPESNQAFLDGINYAEAEAPVWDGSWADFNATVQPLWDSMIAGQITPEEFGQQACEQTQSAFNQ